MVVVPSWPVLLASPDWQWSVGLKGWPLGVCTIFADAPETVELLECYQKVAEDHETCLGRIAQCLLGDLLKGCLDAELAALLTCGAPSNEVCMDLQQMCGGNVPPICE